MMHRKTSETIKDEIIGQINGLFDKTNFSDLNALVNVPANDNVQTAAELINLLPSYPFLFDQAEFNNAVMTPAHLEQIRQHAVNKRNQLRGKQYFKDFINGNVRNSPILSNILNVNEVKGALIKRWGQNNNPPVVNLDSIRNSLANLDSNKGTKFRDVFTAEFGNVPGFRTALQNNANLTTGNPILNQLRGEARYQKFMADNRVALAAMPKLNGILENGTVRAALEGYWGTHTVHTPVDFPRLRTDLANAPDIAAARNAIDVALGNPGLQARLAAGPLAAANSENPLRGEARYLQFMASIQVDLSTLPALQPILSDPNVKNALETHWGTNPLPAPINFARLRTDMAIAANARDARNAINAFTGANLDAAFVTARLLQAPGDENQLRGEARFQQFISRDKIASVPALQSILSTDPVKSHLIDHFGTRALPPDDFALRDAIAGAGNAADAVHNAIVGVLNIAAINLVAVQAASAAAAITEANLLSQAIGHNLFQQFISRDKIASVPALQSILSTDPVKSHLIDHFGATALPPDDFALRDAIARAGNAADAVHNAIVTTLNVLAIDLVAVQTARGAVAPAITEDTLRGQARYQKFMADNDSHLMPELKRILSHGSVKTPLVDRWGTADHRVPDQAGLDTLRDNLESLPILAPGADAAAVNAYVTAAINFIDHAMSGAGVAVPALGLALGELIQTTDDVNKLRGEARYQKFMTDNDAELIKTPALKNILSNAVVRGALETHWKTNLAPAVDFVELRKNLANARNAAHARAIITNAMADPRDNPIPNLNRDLGSAGVLQNDSDVKQLRGEARVFAFLNDPVSQGIPMIDTVFADNAVKTALITHLGNPANNAPNPAVIRNALAGSANNAALRAIFAHPNGLFGVDLPVNTPATLQNDASANALRGQARYQKFMADNQVELSLMPALQRVLSDGNVKTALEKYWATATHPVPANLDTLRNALADATNAAGARTAIDNAMFGNVGGIVGVVPDLGDKLTRLLPDAPAGNENALRGEARYQKFMSDNAIFLDSMPELRFHLERNKALLITHYGTFDNSLPTTAHLKTLRQNLINSLDSAAAINHIHTAMKAGGATDVDNLVHGLGISINNEAALRNLRNEAITSQRNADEIIRKQYCKDLHEKIVEFKKARDNFKSTDNVTTKTNLETAAQQLLAILPPENDLHAPLTKLKTSLTSGESEKMRAALNDTQVKYSKLSKGARSIIDDNVNRSLIGDAKNFKSGPNAYLVMAKKYRDEVNRRKRSLSPEDAAELKSIKTSCNTMMNAIDLAEGELLKNKEYYENPDFYKKPANKLINRDSNLKDIQTRLRIIADTRNFLNEANEEIKLAQGKPRVEEINCYSDEHEIIDAANYERDIETKIGELHGRSAVIGLVAADTSFSKTFGTDKLRLNYTNLHMQTEKKGILLGEDKFEPTYFASVQGNIDGRYTSRFYYNTNDIDKLPLDQIVKIAAIEVENYLAGLEDKKEMLTLKGNMHPKLAEAICIYCSIKGFNKPYSSSIKLPVRTDAELKEYKEEFAGILKDNSSKIFPNRTDLGMSAEKLKELQAATQTEPEEPKSTIKPGF